jgi:V8-like Glu-specific endopeptidase
MSRIPRRRLRMLSRRSGPWSGGQSRLRGLIRRGLPRVALASAAALSLVLMTPSAGDPAAWAAQIRAPKATSFVGTPAVGALFENKNGKLAHFCTASVVHSPGGDLLLTAAHCLQGRSLTPAGTISFAPGYHNGQFPYGRWIVRSVFTDSQWQKDQNPADDFAFLIAGRPGARIERNTGAETLYTGAALPKKAQVIGYPDSSNLPLGCNATVRHVGSGHPDQEMFRCDGYTNGTSGAPFLAKVNAATGTGQVMGAIGGYEEGGDTADVSYSARFLASIAALYGTATGS